MSPRYGQRETACKSGARAATAPASGSATSRSSLAPTTTTLSTGSPRASATSPRVGPTPSSSGLGGDAGNSSSMQPSPRSAATSSPERVPKRRRGDSRPPGAEKRACAAARVACPQRSTSTDGVNQRSSNVSPRAGSPSRPSTSLAPVGHMKAVSDRFWFAATAPIQVASAGASSRQTAAGLPAKATRVNESTCSNAGQRSSAITSELKDLARNQGGR
mmetsp:Transcript_43274/g.136839  ORF Transcript_43274/g.136839 Transcript_43274/m.136839 type:complete len:218 (+) Transcript_43274:424-1077(+)